MFCSRDPTIGVVRWADKNGNRPTTAPRECFIFIQEEQHDKKDQRGKVTKTNNSAAACKPPVSILANPSAPTFISSPQPHKRRPSHPHALQQQQPLPPSEKPHAMSFSSKKKRPTSPAASSVSSDSSASLSLVDSKPRSSPPFSSRRPHTPKSQKQSPTLNIKLNCLVEDEEGCTSTTNHSKPPPKQKPASLSNSAPPAQKLLLWPQPWRQEYAQHAARKALAAKTIQTSFSQRNAASTLFLNIHLACRDPASQQFLQTLIHSYQLSDCCECFVGGVFSSNIQGDVVWHAASSAGTLLDARDEEDLSMYHQVDETWQQHFACLKGGCFWLPGSTYSVTVTMTRKKDLQQPQPQPQPNSQPQSQPQQPHSSSQSQPLQPENSTKPTSNLIRKWMYGRYWFPSTGLVSGIFSSTDTTFKISSANETRNQQEQHVCMPTWYAVFSHLFQTSLSFRIEKRVSVTPCNVVLGLPSHMDELALHSLVLAVLHATHQLAKPIEELLEGATQKQTSHTTQHHTTHSAS